MVSRRQFLVSAGIAGGGLVVGLSFLPQSRRSEAAKYVTNDSESLLTSWLKIDRDNHITVYVPHAEMGQGVTTALPMMLAEELEADWQLVRAETAPATTDFANAPLVGGFVKSMTGMQIPVVLSGVFNYSTMKLAELANLQMTGGSMSVRMTGHYGMRLQGAAAKEMLLLAAANRWGVPVQELTAANSLIRHENSSRKASYGELATEAALLDPPDEPRLKQKSDYTIVGRSQARFDIPAKVDGTEIYGIDVDLPDMKFAAVKTAPVFGAKVQSFEPAAVENMPGVVKALQIPGAVAVIADSFWQANKAVEKLPVTFTKPAQVDLSSAQIYSRQADELDRIDELGETDVELGDVAKTPSAARLYKAEYQVPYLAHAAMETVNCTVWIKADGSVEYWAGLQAPLMASARIAELLDIDQERVTCHHVAMGGAFGRRAGGMNFIEQAVHIAAQVPNPVKLIWTRAEDMQQDYYRPAVTSRFEAKLDDNNAPLSWVNSYIGKNVPPDAAHIPYEIPNQWIRYVDSENPIPVGTWRSVDHSQHGFFVESFIDELAIAAGKDPYLFRRQLLSQSPRLQQVLSEAAERADWTRPLPEGWGRGIALQYSFESVVAQVVEVSFDSRSKPIPERVVCVIDCGQAINPDNVRAQMEGGIIYGLTAALFGDIVIDKGRVVQRDFNDYEMLRMQMSPQIETHIIESDYPLGGVGEPGTPPVTAALTNAIYDVTGTRVRSLPIKHYDFAWKAEEEKA